jgi:hypothetical protein
VPEHLPELGDVDLERGRGGLRRGPVPELVDQPVSRDDPVRLEEQEGEQPALLGAAERQRTTVLDGLERAEDPVLDARVRLL